MNISEPFLFPDISGGRESSQLQHVALIFGPDWLIGLIGERPRQSAHLPSSAADASTKASVLGRFEFSQFDHLEWHGIICNLYPRLPFDHTNG